MASLGANGERRLNGPSGMIRITPVGAATPAPARSRQSRDRFALSHAGPAATASAGMTGLLGLQETPDLGLKEAMQGAESVLDALSQLQAQLLTGSGRGEGQPNPESLLAALEATRPGAAHSGLAGVVAAIRIRAQVVAMQLQRNRNPIKG